MPDLHAIQDRKFYLDPARLDDVVQSVSQIGAKKHDENQWIITGTRIIEPDLEEEVCISELRLEGRELVLETFESDNVNVDPINVYHVGIQFCKDPYEQEYWTCFDFFEHGWSLIPRGRNAIVRKGELEFQVTNGIVASTAAGDLPELSPNEVRGLFESAQFFYDHASALNSMTTSVYLGPEFTFSHMAARNFQPDQSFIPVDFIPDILRITAAGEMEYHGIKRKVDFGVVPFENIRGGEVVDTLEALLDWHKQGGLRIVASRKEDIEMTLGAIAPPEEIKVIYSHPKGLMQCRRNLSERFPNARQVPVSSTAKGAELAAKEPNAGALASPAALEAYGLNSLGNFADEKDNITEFLLVQKDGTSLPSGKRKKNRTTIAVEQRHPLDDLPQRLRAICLEHGLTMMEPLYRRPTGTDMSKYYFHVPGHERDNPAINQLLAELSDTSGIGQWINVFNLGSYVYRDYFPPEIRNIGIIGAGKRREQVLRSFFEKLGYSVNITDAESQDRRTERIHAALTEICSEMGYRGRKDDRVRAEDKELLAAMCERFGFEPNASKRGQAQEPKSKEALSDELLERYRERARTSDAIVLHSYGLDEKDEMRLVKGIAEYVHSRKLLVVNSRYLAGKEEQYRAWIREEMERIIPRLVRKFSHTEDLPATSLEKFVRSYMQSIEGSEDQISKALVDIHCGGCQMVGMKLLVSPETSEIHGENVVFTSHQPVQARTIGREFMGIFYRSEFHVEEATPEQHDLYTGLATNIATLVSQITATTIQAKADFSTLMHFANPNARNLLAATVMILSEDPENRVRSMVQYDDRQELFTRFDKAYREAVSIGSPPRTGGRLSGRLYELAAYAKQHVELARKFLAP